MSIVNIVNTTQAKNIQQYKKNIQETKYTVVLLVIVYSNIRIFLARSLNK
jgi:hypothetical protein